MGAKTVKVEQIGNPCQLCGGPQVGHIHYNADGEAEMMVVKCLKGCAEKRLYAGRREPRYRGYLSDAMSVKEKYARKG